jgi:prepilin-type N-terminal cleavage/methylation domain-containing protein
MRPGMRTEHPDQERKVRARSRVPALSTKRGLTLIELIIGLLVSLIVMLGAGSVFLSTNRSFQTQSRKLLAQREASLLSAMISREIRLGSNYVIYDISNPGAPADSGNGIAVQNGTGLRIGSLEWDPVKHTLVDSLGARVTSMRLTNVKFLRLDQPKAIRYRFSVDDSMGSLVDIESAVHLRN